MFRFFGCKACGISAPWPGIKATHPPYWKVTATRPPVVFVVQWLSCVPLFATPWAAAHQASLSFSLSQSLLKLLSIESVMPSSHLILCHPLLILPSVFPSIRVFSSEEALLVRWPEYWRFSFSISPSNECSELISFRIDWLDLLDVQGTLKSVFQHHSSKASILWCSAFFMVQLSHLYITTGKTIALTRRIFVSLVMFLLFNTLSTFVIVSLGLSKRTENGVCLLASVHLSFSKPSSNQVILSQSLR